MPAKITIDNIVGSGLIEYLREKEGGAVVVTGAIAAVECINEEGERSTWTFWDDQSGLATSLGLVQIMAFAADECLAPGDPD